MQIEFDTDKREKTLAERGLDFARAGEVFGAPLLTMPDTRINYGEPRFITFGLLDSRWTVLVWTRGGLPYH